MSKPRAAYIIGSGPNGLTAAIVLARAGLDVTVIEAESTIGGGTRTAELTLPGFLHDVCSAVHPLAISSPALNSFPLAEHGLEWIIPPLPVAHPVDGGSAAVLHHSLEETAVALGEDGAAYMRVAAPLVRQWRGLVAEILAPAHIPSKPFLLAKFGFQGLWPATSSARWHFKTKSARALFAGIAAHSVMPLEATGSSAFGWVLALAAHGAGWPVARGGSSSIAKALASYLQSLGGRVVTGTRISSLADLDRDAILLFDLSPQPFLNIAGDSLPDNYRRELRRFRYGPGVFKVDWALSRPIPWSARECLLAGTVHVGGSLEEISESERAAIQGTPTHKPFVIVTQPSLFDSSRSPAGRHTAWAYCHVPHASADIMTPAIESQIERFAPGFRANILARHTSSPAQIEARNANMVGGDISGGAHTLKQILFRPTRSLYRTPLRGVYLCSSSTPPGGGVHGMCGFHAARAALADAGIPALTTR